MEGDGSTQYRKKLNGKKRKEKSEKCGMQPVARYAVAGAGPTVYERPWDLKMQGNGEV